MEDINLTTPVIQTPKTNWLLFLLVGMIILGVGITIGLFLGKQIYSPNTVQINSYDQCIAAKGSYLQESNPATCVAVTGQRFKKPISQPTPTPITDLTANWKTYTNTKLGFELKYPESWKSPAESDKTIQFKNSKLIVFVGLHFDANLQKNLTLDEYTVRTFGDETRKEDFNLVGWVGKRAKEINKDGLVTETVILSMDKKSTTIATLVFKYSQNSPEEAKTFNQILSTFKFIEQTSSVDTASWKTYTNEKYGFLFKYPVESVLQTQAGAQIYDFEVYVSQIAKQLGYANTNIRFLMIGTKVSYSNQAKSFHTHDSGWMQNPGTQYSEMLNITLAGFPAITFNASICPDTGNYCEKIDYYFLTNGKSNFLIISTHPIDQNKQPVNKDLLNQILSTFKFVGQTTLVSVDHQTQVSGARCAPVSTESIVTITIPMENVPQPRCVHVTSNQKLKIINNSQGSININVGEFQTSLVPTQSFQFTKTMGEFLAPGGHFIAGAEIFLE